MALNFEALWVAAERTLKEAFADACDVSLAMTVATSGGGKVLGTGEHFRALALPGQGRAGLDLVLKLPLEDLEEREKIRLRDVHARLSRMAAPLLPPMRVIDLPHGGFAVIQPRATAGLAAAAPEWQPMERSLEEAVTRLCERGIHLGDLPQGGTWNGIPFLYDWSDARLAQPA